jgi:ubiquinone/menaquinone biosynthesis C-methylase UbiE
MKNKEMKAYMQELIQKYDYYDPVHDRSEALRFGNVKNKKILDIGAGEGYLAIIAAKNFNCEVMTIDISKEKINTAKRNAKKDCVLDKIKFKLCNALDIPFKKNSYDISVSFNALHHNKGDYKRIIQEMFRVSKEKVVVTELNKTGAHVFDEYIHIGGNHKGMVISLEDLEQELNRYSKKVKRLDRKLMSTFVCKKIIAR